MTKINNKYLSIIIISTIFGLLSGTVSSIVSRVYILKDAFNVPLLGEINYSEGTYGSSLVIGNAKKVIIQQDTKISNTANSVRDGMVGIYKKIETPISDTSELKFDLKNFYKLDNELSQGYSVTSDGWVITPFIPDQKLLNLSEEKRAEKLKDLAKNYVIISTSHEIFPVEQIIIKDNHSFFQIKAKDLSVRKFAEKEELLNGQIVFSTNWDKQVWTTSILDANQENKILLSDDTKTEFVNSFLFNLNGDLLGMINKTGDVEPIYSSSSFIKDFLNSEKNKSINLNIEYSDLSKYISQQGEKMKGILITKVLNKKDNPSPLLENDIITTIGNKSISNEKDYKEALSLFSVADFVNISVLRSGKLFVEKIQLK